MKRNLIMGVVAGFTLAIITLGFWCGIAKAAKPLHPKWAGPIYGTFYGTNEESQDSSGVMAKIQTAIGTSVTNPINVLGWTMTPEVEFIWTAWNGFSESSKPFNELLYNWRPLLKFEPGDSTSILDWVKVVIDDHDSNGEDGAESRSTDRFAVDTKWQFKFDAIEIDVYANVYWYYKYGTNSEGVQGINTVSWGMVDNLGGDITIRGRVDALQAAVSFGLDWQEVQAYIPLHEWYKFGLYAQYHNGKMEGMLDYQASQRTIAAGFAIAPN